MLPKDPFMLLSYVNTQLRDNYESLDEMCASMDLDKEEIVSKLSGAGFEYVQDLNKFM